MTYHSSKQTPPQTGGTAQALPESDWSNEFLADRREILKGMFAAAVAGLGATLWPADAMAQQPSVLDSNTPVTPALAYASHHARVVDLARAFVTHDDRANLDWYLPGGARGPNAEEDSVTALIAHCHVLRHDPSFSRPGSKPSAQLVPEVTKQLVRNSTLGTPSLLHSDTSYDVAVRGLLVLYLRYPDLIGEAGKNHILLNLFPPDLKGGHPQEIEVVELANGLTGEGQSNWSKVVDVLISLGGPSAALIEAQKNKTLRVPETENHLLMIESSRYLINQIERVDNMRNGLRDWLLQRMAVLAQHDFLEFNSRPYSRYSLLALFNLHEFAADPEIKLAAQQVLDYIMMKFALSSSRGRRVTPFRRQQYRINHANGARDDLLADNTDEVAGMFLAFVTPTSTAGLPVADFPTGLLYSAVLAGTAAYRPTPAAYILALDSTVPPSFHRFYHGARPQLPASPDIAEPGLELYANSPSFLVTAGGSFLNSGYGKDEINLPLLKLYAWQQTSRAQATTLIPKRMDLAFHDLLRFEPYPDPMGDPMAHADNPTKGEQADMYHTSSVNTAVQIGLMAGANLRPAEKRTIYEQNGLPAICFQNEQTYVAWTSYEISKSRVTLGIGRVKTASVMGLDGVEGLSDVIRVTLSHWSSGLPQPNVLLASPAICPYGFKTALAWIDPLNSRIQVAAYTPGGKEIQFQTSLAETSKFGPALVQHNGSVYLGWTGTDHRLNVARLQFDLAAHRFYFDRKVTLADTSDAGPSLASLRGELFVAWQGTGDNKLNISLSQDNGTTFTGKATYEQASSDQPSLTAYGDYLHMAWKGHRNDSIFVAKVIVLGNTAGKTSLGDLAEMTILGERTSASPAICGLPHMLCLGWAGVGEALLNLRVSSDGQFQEWSGWQFLNHSDAGFYVAIYRTPPSAAQPLLDNLGIVYAVEKLKMDALGIDYNKFQAQTRLMNAHLPAKLQYGGTYSFLPPDGRKFVIWFKLEGDKYRARVTETHQFITQFDDGALVDGPFMTAPGKHDGLLEIRHPGCEAAPVVLDMRDWRNPKRDDAKQKCPGPWIDRADALIAVANKLKTIGREAEAQAAKAEGEALRKEMAPFMPPPPAVPAAPAASTASPQVALGIVQKLQAMNVDYSVKQSELLGWLQNPQYTPYPAISSTLIGSGWRFRAPIYLDVIVAFYEKTPGVRSPRAKSDVQPNVLHTAILAAYNERYGAKAKALTELLR